ncbi:MAG: SIS domain-containing protein [Gemmataceae bacterium]
MSEVTENNGFTAYPQDPCAYAREVLRAEARALETAAEQLDGRFTQALTLLADPARLAAGGRLGVTGVGKSADIGQKLVGTLNSTGTRSYVLDATRAVHGDLGMVHPEDALLLLSHSGESEELLRLLPPLREMARHLIGITGNPKSTLALKTDVALVYGPLDEVCPLGLAPSASTTTMLALGDAIAFSLSRAKNLTSDQFARFHPAGSLGRKLSRVDMVMRQGRDMRVAHADETVRQVYAQARQIGRRTGAVMLVDDLGTLRGIFTDSDLARLIEQRREADLDLPIRAVMTREPATVALGSRAHEAMELMRRRKLSELPVVDGEGRPVGILDITDLVGVAGLELVQQGESGDRDAALRRAA